MRIFHIAVVVSDLERSADFYQGVFDFRALGQRRPGNFPGTAFDLTDGEVHFSLLQSDEGVPGSEWTHGRMGPNHVGLLVEDLSSTRDKLLQREATVFGERYSKDGTGELVYFKCLDPDGAEIDVSKRPFNLDPA